jgi:hypothetical protein
VFHYSGSCDNRWGDHDEEDMRKCLRWRLALQVLSGPAIVGAGVLA